MTIEPRPWWSQLLLQLAEAVGIAIFAMLCAFLGAGLLYLVAWLVVHG